MTVRKAKSQRVTTLIVAIASVQNGEGVAVEAIVKSGGEEASREKERNIVGVAVGAESM